MKKRVISILFIVLTLGIASWLTAGSLEPPAAPGPTMKTLDEVEPGIAVNADNTPGDSSYVYIISNPGSYYLTGNVSAFNSGIKIASDDVTLCLKGYSITGIGNDYGIHIDGKNNVKIYNGTIRGFNYGIYEGSLGSNNNSVINLTSTGNERHGIWLHGRGHLVKNCTVTENAVSTTYSSYGIYAYDSAKIVGNIVRSNATSATCPTFYAIKANFGSIVSDNVCSENGNTSSSTIYGINSGSGSKVTGNTIYRNGYKSSGTLYGIISGSGCTVRGNTVYDNGRLNTGTRVYGIFPGNGCTVVGNTSYSNGISAAGNVYGIQIPAGCLVDQNTVYANGSGASGTVINMPLGVSGCVYGNNVAP